MKRPSIVNNKCGPEAKIQQNLIRFLQVRGWYVKSTHGNQFQSGFPDLYASHPKYMSRWIEVKNATAYSFTNAQRIEFPLLAAHGVGIWILCDATDCEYNKLFKPPNWGIYFTMLDSRGARSMIATLSECLEVKGT